MLSIARVFETPNELLPVAFGQNLSKFLSVLYKYTQDGLGVKGLRQIPGSTIKNDVEK